MRRHISSKKQYWDEAAEVALLHLSSIAAEQKGGPSLGSSLAYCSSSGLASNTKGLGLTFSKCNRGSGRLFFTEPQSWEVTGQN